MARNRKNKAGASEKRGLPLDGYIRVSRVGGRDKSDGFISPKVQGRAIEEFAKRTGRRVVLHPPELDQSGGTMDRPIFNQIMERIRRGKSGGIVVYKVDRFARTLRGALNTLAELGEHEAAFASCSEEISYFTAQEKALLQMQFVFAELFRGQTKEDWAQARKQAVERGVHICRDRYLGYDKEPGQPFVKNEQAGLARELFLRRARGASWPSLCDYLDGKAPLPDGQRWDISRLQRMLASRVYRGEAYHGQYRNPQAHEAIVSEAEWQAAQAARTIPLPAKSDKEPILLRGLVRCANCRYVMSEGQAGGRKKTIRTYRCLCRAKSGRCPAPQHVVGENLEAFVVERFKEQLRGIIGRAVPDSDELDAARRELREAEAELTAFTSDLETAQRLRSVGQYEQALDPRLRAVEATRQRLGQLTAELPDEVDLENWEFDIDEWWEPASTETRIRVLNASIDAVFVRGPGKSRLEERVLILWRGQGPDDLPRRGRANGPLRSFVWPGEDEGKAREADA